MRICQLSHVEQTYNFLAPLFFALRDEGHEVVAACNLEAGGAVIEHYLGPGFRTDVVHVGRKVTLPAVTTDITRLARYLRRERFDVLHVHSPLVAMQGRVAARIAGVPTVIYEAHGFYFHDNMATPARTALLALERQFGRWLTDYIVTVNEEDWRLARRYHFRPDPAQIVHVPGVGVDTTRFHPATADDEATRARLRLELGATDDDLVVTFVGRVVREKGILELAQAFIQLAAVHPARLWLIGDVLESERDQCARLQLGQLLRSSPVGPRVQQLGHRSDVADLLRASDVFALPSYREGMPVSLMEAMACGVACVAANVRGCREVLDGGRAGVLVPPRDAAALRAALLDLSADADRRAALGKLARERIQSRYDAERAVAPLLALYRGIADATGERA